MTVSVIIPAYNASATLARALEALQHQDTDEPFEVIVVDDGSTDGTKDVAARFPHVKYVYQDNAGPAQARNHGAMLALGKFLCFTDSDCIPHKDWISKLLGGFHQPDIAVVCGSYGIANPEDLLSNCIHSEIIFRHKFLMPDFPKVFGSYNFCVKKMVFGLVGGFNTGYANASGEDNDLSYKIIAAGHKIYFERNALVDHYHTTRIGKYLKEQFRHGFWRAKMYIDHLGMVRGDGYTFWKDALEVPWVGFCILGLALSCSQFGGFKGVIYFLFVLFLVFEIFFARWMLKQFFGGIFFGFVMFVRAFVRTLGLSTGILYFVVKKTEKIFK